MHTLCNRRGSLVNTQDGENMVHDEVRVREKPIPNPRDSRIIRSEVDSGHTAVSVVQQPTWQARGPYLFSKE